MVILESEKYKSLIHKALKCSQRLGFASLFTLALSRPYEDENGIPIYIYIRRRIVAVEVKPWEK